MKKPMATITYRNPNFFNSRCDVLFAFDQEDMQDMLLLVHDLEELGIIYSLEVI